MSPALTDAVSDLPQLLRAHAILSGAAVGLAILAGLPLAWWATRSRRVRVPLLAAAGLIQTVPTLALLALFYPALLLIGSATRLPVPALGFLPALLALTLYALLPILRNGVAGLTGLDRSVLEAADAVGMTRRQRLLQVELPLSAPVLLAGIRTAAIWTIGAATLATTVGQPSLGNLIFSGLQTENWVRVLVGCGAAAALAILVDALLAMVESGVAKRSPARMTIAAALLVLGAALALVPIGGGVSGRRPIVVGAKNFAEQYILASAIAQRLGAAGFPAVQRDDLGSAVAYRALAAGDIDAYVDYSGTLWANVLGRSDTPPAETMRAELVRRLWARDGVTLLGPLRLRECLCAGDAAPPRGGTRRPHDRRSCRTGAASAPCQRHRVFRSPGMAGLAQGVRPALRRRPRLQSDLHVPCHRRRQCRRDLGFLVGRADRCARSRRA